MAIRPMPVNGSGTLTSDWRNLTRRPSVSIPQWLSAARALRVTPTIPQIAALARDILSSYRITILLGGETIEETGLTSRLGAVTRTEAFRVLLIIAQAGIQREEVAVNFEDARACIGAGMGGSETGLDIGALADLPQIRKTLAGLAAINVIVTTPQKKALSDELPKGLYAIALAVRQEHPGKSLAAMLDEWAKAGWALFHDSKQGRYSVADVISDMQ